MNHNIDCPHCKGSIIKSQNNEAKLRAKLILWNKKGMFAVCKSCNREVEIDPEVMKSIKAAFTYEINTDKK